MNERVPALQACERGGDFFTDRRYIARNQNTLAEQRGVYALRSKRRKTTRKGNIRSGGGGKENEEEPERREKCKGKTGKQMEETSKRRE